jgi:hypothetical protein
MPRYISADDFLVELHNMGLVDKSGWIRASITNMNIILAKCSADAEPPYGTTANDYCSWGVRRAEDK